jgi:crotonobetainyl-CoA:carnitine CoA-transferase CaiB-like acyl-CoA transferase
MTHRPASSALSRFKVLDLTRVRAGPTCVRQLADWGADVIKIELPDTGDGGEQLGGPREGSDFQNLHRGKRAISLNLKSSEGVAILHKLVQRADILVENYRPDVKHRLKIDYETLSAINPRLIYGSISGFGQTGPYAGRPGFDQIAQGMGGLMSITGTPGQGPMRVGIPIADLTAGIFCAYGLLVALLEREVSGKGQWVQTSLLEAQIFMLDFQNARWLMDQEVPKQAGNNHPTSIPTGVFKTQDGYINIAVAGQRIWERFCQAVEAKEWLDNPDYATPPLRSKNRDALNQAIEARIKQASSKHWVEALNKAGVPAGPIYKMDEVFADPQVEHLGLVEKIHSSLRGDTQMVGQPVTLSRTPSELQSSPPLAGEHTDEVLREIGYSDAEIAGFHQHGVV